MLYQCQDFKLRHSRWSLSGNTEEDRQLRQGGLQLKDEEVNESACSGLGLGGVSGLYTSIWNAMEVTGLSDNGRRSISDTKSIQWSAIWMKMPVSCSLRYSATVLAGEDDRPEQTLRSGNTI
jgi:hypothetical protein